MPWFFIISRALCWHRRFQRLNWNSTRNFILGKYLSLKLKQTNTLVTHERQNSHQYWYVQIIFIIHTFSSIRLHLKQKIKNTFLISSHSELLSINYFMTKLFLGILGLLWPKPNLMMLTLGNWRNAVIILYVKDPFLFQVSSFLYIFKSINFPWTLLAT